MRRQTQYRSTIKSSVIAFLDGMTPVHDNRENSRAKDRPTLDLEDEIDDLEEEGDDELQPFVLGTDEDSAGVSVKSTTFTSPRYACSKKNGWELIVWLLVAVFIFLVVVRIGAHFEGLEVHNSIGTLDLYEQTTVCGIYTNYHKNIGSHNGNNTVGSAFSYLANQPSNMNVHVESFSSVEAFDDFTNSLLEASEEMRNPKVANCGSCGYCSTSHDVQIYQDTRRTLLADATHCAQQALTHPWNSRNVAKKCLTKRVGFTEECNNCWVDNILCDLSLCLFTCTWHVLFESAEGHDKPLNPCTQCDEMRCGRAFLNCAGANRRRAGIVSDIDRDNDKEMCHDVTPKWWEDPELKRLFQSSSLSARVIP